LRTLSPKTKHMIKQQPQRRNELSHHPHRYLPQVKCRAEHVSQEPQIQMRNWSRVKYLANRATPVRRHGRGSTHCDMDVEQQKHCFLERHRLAVARCSAHRDTHEMPVLQVRRSRSLHRSVKRSEIVGNCTW
jgi:hypothetical protein